MGKRKPTKYGRTSTKPTKIHSGVLLQPDLIINLDTRTQLTLTQFNKELKAWFQVMSLNQNKIIQANLDPIPERDKTSKLSLNMWASKNIILPEDYDETLTKQVYWDKINNKLEAYRLLSSYRDRQIIFDLTHDNNGDPLPVDQLPKDITAAMGKDYVDNEGEEHLE